PHRGHLHLMPRQMAGHVGFSSRFSSAIDIYPVDLVSDRLGGAGGSARRTRMPSLPRLRQPPMAPVRLPRHLHASPCRPPRLKATAPVVVHHGPPCPARSLPSCSLYAPCSGASPSSPRNRRWTAWGR